MFDTGDILSFLELVQVQQFFTKVLSLSLRRIPSIIPVPHSLGLYLNTEGSSS